MNKQDLLNVTDGEVLKALISAMPPYELRIMYYELGSLLREHHAMDEDLRDAIEILVSECSCYTPFRAFLMDVVLSLIHI